MTKIKLSEIHKISPEITNIVVRVDTTTDNPSKAIVDWNKINSQNSNTDSSCQEFMTARHGHVVWRMRHRGGVTNIKCLKAPACTIIGCNGIAKIDTRYSGEEPYCSVCGKILGDFMNYCGNCGAILDDEISKFRITPTKVKVSKAK